MAEACGRIARVRIDLLCKIIGLFMVLCFVALVCAS